MKKNQARKKYKAFRNKLSDLKIKKLSNQIFQQSLKLKIWNKDTYMLYRPIKSKKEVDLSRKNYFSSQDFIHLQEKFIFLSINLPLKKILFLMVYFM